MKKLFSTLLNKTPEEANLSRIYFESAPNYSTADKIENSIQKELEAKLKLKENVQKEKTELLQEMIKGLNFVEVTVSDKDGALQMRDESLKTVTGSHEGETQLRVLGGIKKDIDGKMFLQVESITKDEPTSQGWVSISYLQEKGITKNAILHKTLIGLRSYEA